MRSQAFPFPLLSKSGLNVKQIENRSIGLKARSQIRLRELAANALQDDLLGFRRLGRIEG